MLKWPAGMEMMRCTHTYTCARALTPHQWPRMQHLTGSSLPLAFISKHGERKWLTALMTICGTHFWFNRFGIVSSAIRLLLEAQCVCVCVFATCIMSMSSSSCSSIFQCTTLQTLFTIIILLQAPTLGYRNPLLFLLLLLLSFSIARCVCCRSSFDAPMIWSGSRVRLRCVQVFDDINWEQDNWITNLIYLNCNFDFYSCRISLYFQQKWKFIM